MVAKDDWRQALTATERFENIQQIEQAMRHPYREQAMRHPAALVASAITLENEAFLSSTSREDYDAACAVLAKPLDNADHNVTHAIPGPADFEDEPTGGVAIGEYKNCHYLASGTSADVYRSGGYALKVARSAVGPPPHNARREAQILRALQEPCVPLVATFSDAEQRLVLVLPFMPLTLDALLYGKQSKSAGSVSRTRLKLIFTDLFRGLVQLHSQGIIHRDVKPSSVLLASADGPAYLSDFGTAWHPALSRDDEPADHMVLDIGTGPYRAPETLFGNQAYGPAVDLWAAGCMLAECARQPPTPLFESRAVHEDGNQLGLILSIFKTLGTPTRASWPEAEKFKTPPFEMYRVFEPQPWTTILPDVDADVRGIIEGLVRFDSTTRLTAEEALSSVEALDTA